MTQAAHRVPTVLAAGGVVTRKKRGADEFLLVHRPRYNDWSLPKGKLNDGEGFPAAAAREVEEETGSTVRQMASVGSIAYQSDGGQPKLVRYWLFEHLGGTFAPNHEVDETRWIQREEALGMMTYPRDRNVLAWGAKLADSPQAGRVHLVRHAEAGSRAAWEQLDHIRPLTNLGRRQARKVGHRLTATPVNDILTSKYTRCVQTVEPLGTAINEDVQIEKSITEGASTAGLLAILKTFAGRAVVMCSHGKEIAALIEAVLAAGARLEPGPRTEARKGAMWTLELDAGVVTSGRYVPPPG